MKRASKTKNSPQKQSQSSPVLYKNPVKSDQRPCNMLYPKYQEAVMQRTITRNADKDWLNENVKKQKLKVLSDKIKKLKANTFFGPSQTNTTKTNHPKNSENLKLKSTVLLETSGSEHQPISNSNFRKATNQNYVSSESATRNTSHSKDSCENNNELGHEKMSTFNKNIYVFVKKTSRTEEAVSETNKSVSDGLNISMSTGDEKPLIKPENVTRKHDNHIQSYVENYQSQLKVTSDSGNDSSASKKKSSSLPNRLEEVRHALELENVLIIL